MTTDTSAHLFESRAALDTLEHDRLTALTGLFDPATRRHLDALGLGHGWRCLEIGAGTGSIARWMAERAGREGEVFATDVDVRYLGELPPTVTHARHDIVTDSLPDAAFDLVHARLLLEHLSGREIALRRIAASLRPGGYVLLEEAEMSATAIALLVRYVAPGQRELATKVLHTVAGLLAVGGADMSYASRLPDAMRAAGLEVTGAEIHCPVVLGGGDMDFCRLTVLALRRHAVAAGLVTEDEVDRFLDLTTDPEAQYLPFVMTSVWGRRPS